MTGQPPADASGAPQEVCQAIRAAREVALVGHVNPDADCLGAMGALWLALPELGKPARAVLPAGTVSRRLEYLVRHAGTAPAAPHELRRCDLAIVLDTARERRANLEGRLEAMHGAAVVNIDHHATNTRFGRWNWVDPQRSSTSEMVYDLLRALGCQITPTVATLLYAGIHADTQGFSLSNTTARSLLVAHDLAQAGARVAEVCERLHRSLGRGEFELIQRVYANTRVSDDGLVAWSTLSHEEILASGCGPSDIDTQVEVPRSVEGIAVALLFSETRPGRVRINFRAEGTLSVLELAQQFGGGGHRASAGAMVDGPLEQVVQRVVAAARAWAAGG